MILLRILQVLRCSIAQSTVTASLDMPKKEISSLDVRMDLDEQAALMVGCAVKRSIIFDDAQLTRVFRSLLGFILISLSDCLFWDRLTSW